jgi:hypothetical protein
MNAVALRTLALADARILWRDPLLKWVLGLPLGLATLRRERLPGSRREADDGECPDDCHAGTEEIGPGWTLALRQPQPHE